MGVLDTTVLDTTVDIMDTMVDMVLDTTVLVANLPHVLTLSMLPFPVLLAVNAVMLRLLPKPKLIPLTSMVDTMDILVLTDMEVTTVDMLDTMDMDLAKLPLVSMPITFLSPVPKMFVQKIQKCPFGLKKKKKKRVCPKKKKKKKKS